MEKSQTKFFGGKLLIAGVLAGWLLRSNQIAPINPDTAALILVAFVLGLFIFLSKSLYERLAWLLAFQAFGLQPLPVGGIYITVPDIMLVFLLLEAPFALRLRNKEFSPMGILAICLLVSTCISVASSPVMLNILGLSVRYAVALLLFIALDRIEFPEDALRATRRALAFAFPVALILLYFNGELLGMIRSMETGDRLSHSQTLPLLCTLVFPWYLLSHRRPIIGLLLGCLYAAITWAGQSRAMIVAASVTLLIVLSVRLKRKLSSLLVLAAATVMGLLAVYHVMGSEDRMNVMASRADSDEWRIYKMRVSMESFREHPVFGTGPGGEGATSQQRHDEAMVSENGLVQSLAESGLVGTTLFLAIVLYSAWQCYHLARRRIIGRKLAGALGILLVATVAPLSYGSGAGGVTVWLFLLIIDKHVGRARSIPTSGVFVRGTPS